MTVTDIKEFIDYQITKCTVINDKGNVYYDKIGINNSLEKIKSMLDELEDNTDNTTEWIKLTTHGMIRFQCKKCDSIFSLPWEHCPKCGRKVTNNIKTNVHKYNYETGKLEELK